VVIQAVRKAAAETGLAAAIPRAHHHIETALHFSQQQGDMLGPMLAVGIHEHDDFTLRHAGTALDAGAIAHRIRIAEHAHAGLFGHAGGIIAGAVVNHNDLGLRMQTAQFGQETLQPR
jgi:hypothetical protein